MALGGLGGAGKVATVFVDVEGDLTNFKKDVAAAGTHAEKSLGSRMGRAGKVAGTALAVGAGAALAGGVTAFVGFERGMNEVFTLIPEAGQENFDKLTAQTKDFAKEFGVLPEQVIPSLYDALSAGVPRDNVFAFLEDANKFSKAGAVDLGTAVDGLTSTLNAYGLGADQAEAVSDSLFTAVKLGKTTVGELSDSMFQVAPIASAFGVDIDQVSAAFATLTSQGTPTSVAATQIKGAISELGKEGTKASKAFEEMSGQSFPDFIASGGTLQEAAALMRGGADELGVSMVDLFGSIEAGQAFVGLASDVEGAQETLDAVNDSAGATDVAFEQMEKGIGPVLDKLKARFAVLSIEIGQTLAPTIERVGGVVLGFVEALGALPGPVLASIIAAVGFAGALLALSGPILRTIQLVKMMSAVLAVNPYVLIVAATIALAILIVKNWDTIVAAVGAAASAVGDFLTRYISDPAGWIADKIELLPAIFSSAWSSVKQTVADAAMFLLGKFREIGAAADRALGPIDEILGFGFKAGGAVLGAIGVPGFDTGGIVPGATGSPQLILAHGGETVLPTHKRGMEGAAGGGGDTIVVNLHDATIRSEDDVLRLARMLAEETRRTKRSQGVKS